MFVPDTRGILSSRPARSDVIVHQVLPPGPRVLAEWDPPNMGRHGGDPKLETVARPLRTDASEYVGQEQHTRAVTLLFDGWAQGRANVPVTNPAAHRSVEEQCRIVHLWTRPVGGVGSGGPLPQVRVVYGPWQQMLWIVAAARWGEPLLIGGHRIRQEVTLQLREAVSVDLALSPVEQAAEAATGTEETAGGYSRRPGSAVYTVVSGDSLWSIATAQLGDSTRWPEIAELNNLTAPFTIHPGQVLKVPSS